jgi:hypothetical protein
MRLRNAPASQPRLSFPAALASIGIKAAAVASQFAKAAEDRINQAILWDSMVLDE